MQNKFIGLLITAVMGASLTVACNSTAESTQPAPGPRQQEVVAEQTETLVKEAQPQAEAVQEDVVETSDEPVEAAVSVETDVEAKPDTTEDVTAAAEEIVEVDTESAATEDVTEGAALPTTFTATTGLKEFSAYRLDFDTAFDGTHNGQPTSGTLGGLFEVTKSPEAQHWAITMTGNAFQEVALLGGKMEMYDIANTIYIQNPGDDSWIGIPAMFVESMLPTDMVNPEDNIELPATATLQPGKETINGIVTQRYTFGKDDMPGNSAAYDSVDGTVWVAVDDNTVVKYEATVSGEFSHLSAGEMTLLDEGTITMMYEVSNANGDFTINPPADAQTIGLGELLFQ